jgi:hypothetical protein
MVLLVNEEDVNPCEMFEDDVDEDGGTGGNLADLDKGFVPL